MIDFVEAKRLAFLALSQTENVQILPDKEKIEFGFTALDEVWQIQTEVQGKSGVILDVTFYVWITKDFPLSIPRVYLSERDYIAFKYIPHVNSDKFICTFDTEIVRANPEFPAQLVLECLSQAKRIIEAGLSGSNFEDFEKEFFAYWEYSYSTEDKIDKSVLCLINANANIVNPSILILDKKLGQYEYVLHNGDSAADNFKTYLETKDISFTEEPIFYLKQLSLKLQPPFDLSNGQIVQLIKLTSDGALHDFEVFINKKGIVKFVLSLVHADNKPVLIGWFHRKFNLHRNGFRDGFIKNYAALSTFQKADKIIRVESEILTRDRLINRTTGAIPLNEKSFLIAGIGSIGSNLLYFLNSMHYPRFRLVDSDTLKVENIGRHLLGFNYVNLYKTKAAMSYLLNRSPIQEISTRENSIIDILRQEPNYINDADYIFSAMGKTNVDKVLGQAIKEGVIHKPIFFVWIEPYLAAGHCLYLCPNDKDYSSFFSLSDFYKFNVISESYYLSSNNLLTLKEAGCQTTFVPYSANNVIAFLAALFPKISSIIENGVMTTKGFTWVGNLRELANLKIETSEFVKNKISGELIEY